MTTIHRDRFLSWQNKRMESAQKPINPPWLASSRKRSSYHEAGHAVIAMAFGLPARSVSIKKCTDGGGAETGKIDGDSDLARAQRVLVAAAGLGAEMALILREPDGLEGFWGFESDEEQAELDLRLLGLSGTFKRFAMCASTILNEPNYFHALKALAEATLEEGYISDQVKLQALADQVPVFTDTMVSACIKAVVKPRPSPSA